MECVDTITLNCEHDRVITVTSIRSSTHNHNTCKVSLVCDEGAYSCTLSRECELFDILNASFDHTVTYRLAKMVAIPPDAHGYKLTIVVKRQSKSHGTMSQHTEVSVMLSRM